MRISPKGIFCLEGDWLSHLKRPSSVEPILAVIDHQLTPRRHHIHRDIGTIQELRYYLAKWTQKQYSGYPILYLGFHGEKGTINIGDGRSGTSRVSLDDLGKHLAGACDRRLIHFTSCSTLGVNGHQLNSFLKKTRALAISGYETDVDWIKSAAFELLVLSEFQYGALTHKGVTGMYDRILKHAGGLAKELQFRLIVNPDFARK